MASLDNNRYLKLIKRKPLGKYDSNKLWEVFQEYVEFCVNNPIDTTQKLTVTSKGTSRSGQEQRMGKAKKAAPMTQLSFCAFCGRSGAWLNVTERDVKERIGTEHEMEDDKDLLAVIERIRNFLSNQLVDGALVGEYQHGLVGALTGLRQNVDVTSGGDVLQAPVINIIRDTKTREDYNG